MFSASLFATPLSDNGELRVEGVQLVNEDGHAVQLRGVSTHGINWYGQCYKEASMKVLAEDWGVDIVRAAMYVSEDYNGYMSAGNRSGLESQIDDIVNWTEKFGMYCLIDWHVLNPGDPTSPDYSEAKNFFDKMSLKYKDKKHVLYEICNEPNSDNGADDSWSTIKSYAEDIIPVIRKNDPESVIIVGTPNWSQEIWAVVGNELNYDNIMYTFHFYAGTHGGLYDQFAQTVKKIPVFCTEWGLSEADGDGTITTEFKNTADKFLKHFEGTNTDGILTSWCSWAYADKNETSNMLYGNSCGAANWNNTTPTGDWIKAKLQTEDQWTPINSNSNAAPELKNAVASAYSVSLTFNSELADLSGTPDIVVTVNGSLNIVTKSSKSSSTVVEVIVLNEMKAGDVISVSYSGTSIKGANGIAVSAFSSEVTNGMTGQSGDILIDDCEDGDETHNLGGEWYTFDDSENKGESVVAPETGSFVMNSGGANGSSKSAGITYTLDKGNNLYDPFVGLGVALTAKQTAYDVGKSTGISFYHKGDGFTLEVALSIITNYQNFSISVPSHSAWTACTIDWEDLSQPDWGDNNKYVEWNPAKVVKIQFKVAGKTGDSGNLYIDDLAIVGEPVVNTKPYLAKSLPDLTLTEGFGSKTVSISSVFKDADADALSYSVKSSKTAVATAKLVGTSLVITEAGIGTSVITLTANDGNGGTATTAFDVTTEKGNINNSKPTQVAVVPDVEVPYGTKSKIIDLSTYFTDADGDVLSCVVDSYDDNVLSVSASGMKITVVPVVAWGETVVGYTVIDGNGGSCNGLVSVTLIRPQPSGIDWSAPASVNIVLGKTYQLAASISPYGAEGAIEMASTDTSVISVVDGVVTAKNVGTATVTATVSNTSIEKSVVFNVVATAILPGNVLVSVPNNISLISGPTVVAITALPETATSQDYVIESSDTLVAKVDSLNRIIPVSDGMVTITITAMGATGPIVKTVSISVGNPLYSYDTEPNNVVELYPVPMEEILFVSCTESVATVAVYNVKGELLKYEERAGQIYVGDLPVGSYVVAIVFENGDTETYFIVK